MAHPLTCPESIDNCDSLDNCALLHSKPYPVLALGPITLPVGICIAVSQARHIEFLLGRDKKGTVSSFLHFCTEHVLWARECKKA